VNPFSLRIIARLSLHGRSCRACAAGGKPASRWLGAAYELPGDLASWHL